MAKFLRKVTFVLCPTIKTYSEKGHFDTWVNLSRDFEIYIVSRNNFFW